MKGRSRKRVLSREELELWALTTRRDAPLARSRAAASAGRATAGGTGVSLSPAPPGEPATAAPAPPKPQLALANRKPAAAAAPEPFDPRAAKRIARGRREIGARLDLHGMRQEDAYVALRRFLARCQAEGHRHVLIITGKGGGGSRKEREFWSAEERGVLRRLVPHWLCEPSFRLHVVSFTESALKHGGSGALYVTIRKEPRAHR